ncbi:hypothetical protein JYP51_21630 [Ponticoccus gilvus]|nr:hypothetical protein [Enemella evansiae]
MSFPPARPWRISLYVDRGAVEKTCGLTQVLDAEPVFDSEKKAAPDSGAFKERSKVTAGRLVGDPGNGHDMSPGAVNSAFSDARM